MSKRSRSKLPSIKKSAGKADIKRVVKEIRKLVPQTNLDIPPNTKADNTLLPPTKPTDTVKTTRRRSRKSVAKSDIPITTTKSGRRSLTLPPGHDKYFVYLKNPLEYRRHLLESSRRILFCLKSYQKIILIRQKKLDEMKKLKGSLKELMYLNKKFNEVLPQYNVDFLEDMPAISKVEKKTKIPKPPKPEKVVEQQPKEKTELEKLEESLSSIEQKLRNLK